GVRRLDDAELGAFRIGEHDMWFVRALTDVDVPGTQFDQPRHRFVLVVDGCGRQIEMDAVPARLALRNGPEDDSERGAIRWHETDLISGLAVDLPTQSVGPEARETERLVRIDAEGDKPCSHRTLPQPTATAASPFGPQLPDTASPCRSNGVAATGFLAAGPDVPLEECEPPAAGDEGGDDVGGVLVEVAPGAHRSRS